MRCGACGQPIMSEDIVRDRDRYRRALERIAGAESGMWGWIAHRVLAGDDAAPPPADAPVADRPDDQRRYWGD